MSAAVALKFPVSHYNPSVGRFISEDPIGLGGGDSNLFRYVKNRPINFVDPSGNIAGVIVGGIVLGFAIQDSGSFVQALAFGAAAAVLGAVTISTGGAAGIAIAIAFKGTAVLAGLTADLTGFNQSSF